jgi:hypothetical protein
MATHAEQVGAPAAYAELNKSDLVISTVAATRPAVDYLMERGHNREAAEYAATWAYQETLVGLLLSRGPCQKCGRQATWNRSAGLYLCSTHWESY